MRRLVFIFVCWICASSLRASEVTAALTQLHQQFMSLASTLTSRPRDVSIESKIKELEQILTSALNYFNANNTSRNPLFDTYRPQVKKNFTRVFNELLDVAHGDTSLTKQQKEQIMALINGFNREWQIQGDVVTYQKLVNLWNQQHKLVVAQPVSAVKPVEVAASEIANVLAVTQAEMAKIESQAAATRAERAEAARRTKEAQERKESKEEKEKQAQHEREVALEQVKIARKILELQKILQDYKAALKHALTTNASQEEKDKLKEQLVQNFVPLRKELSKFEKEQLLQKQQEEQLKELDKDYENAVQTSLSLEVAKPLLGGAGRESCIIC